MNYKDVLYHNYRSTHNEILQGGAQSLAKIERAFPVFDFYYETLLPADKNVTILDIGCGDGNFVYYLQQRGYSQVEGVDISEEQIALGQKLGIAGLVKSDIIEFVTHKNGVYDCIIAKDVIEHLTRQEAFNTLCLMAKALKPGGQFIMQVPNGQGIHYTSIFYGDYTHEMAYTVQSVRQLLLNTGFSTVKSYPVNPYTGSFFGKIRAVLWKWKVLQVRFWKMVETGNPSGIFTANLIGIGIK